MTTSARGEASSGRHRTGARRAKPPDAVAPDAVNRWLFNADTVDKVLETLMSTATGSRVATGSARRSSLPRTTDHAEFIAERFDANYPEYGGHFARVITYRTEYAQSLIDDFSVKDKSPHIAISVDMLDTGIDVPEVVNLVFFKPVRSKTKFWQMIGRGTRLCPDLFGPGEDKQRLLRLRLLRERRLLQSGHRAGRRHARAVARPAAVQRAVGADHGAGRGRRGAATGRTASAGLREDDRGTAAQAGDAA